LQGPTNQSKSHSFIDILDGECGSLVVDQATNEVYGHLVGSGPDGHVYVVPLNHVFAQIRKSFAAGEVNISVPDHSSTDLKGRHESESSESKMPPPTLAITRMIESERTNSTDDMSRDIVSSGILTLINFAFKSTVTLSMAVRCCRSQNKEARALQDEISDLSKLLESLQKTANSYATIDLDKLKLPLFRCGKACEEYGNIINKFTKDSDASHPSRRSWLTLKYLQGDINQFREMLAGYKSTINVAIAHANLSALLELRSTTYANNPNLSSRVTAVTPIVLKDYKEMVRDTNDNLKEHLQWLEETIQSLITKKTSAPAQDDVEWQAILEKESTQQGLRICAQLSSQIDELMSAHQQRPQAPQLPLDYQYIKDELHAASGSIQTLVHKLQEHEARIDSRMDVISSTAQSSENTSLQLTQLQKIKESISQCIKVVSDVDETPDIDRQNVFEDITMADEAYNFSVSTFGDLTTARRIHLTGKSRHIAGQLFGEGYQATTEAAKMIDLQYQRHSHDGGEETSHESPAQDVK